MDNLLSAIITKTSGSAFASDIGGRIYLDHAPDNAEFPYCVFFIVSDVPLDTFTDSLDDVLVQFSLFSASSGAAEITGMYNDLRSLFDNCTLSITGSTFVSMRRQNLQTMVEESVTQTGTQIIKHWAVDYQLVASI
jgi:hypothetical protein